jgi:carbamoyl-phosphate synthase large subunit
MGIPVKRVSKKLGEGHPNTVDIITDGTVNGVINTISGGRAPLRDGFYIRRAAAERRVPCFTSLDTARVAVQALSNGGLNWNVRPVPEYRKGKGG